MQQELLANRRNTLMEIIRSGLNKSEPHSASFVLRVLNDNYAKEANLEGNHGSGQAAYGGYPEVASLGYSISTGYPQAATAQSQFLQGIERLQIRSSRALQPLVGDDVALLGIADGLATLDLGQPKMRSGKEWLLGLINTSHQQIWSSRMRLLAGDLLDKRGRLRALPSENTDVTSEALELVLREVWQDSYSSIPVPDQQKCQWLLGELLRNNPPDGDIEKSAIQLRAIDLLVARTSIALFPELNVGHQAIAQLTSVKEALDKQAERQIRFQGLIFLLAQIFLIALIAIITYYISWDVVEPFTYFIDAAPPLLSYLYFALTYQEFSIPAIYDKLLVKRKEKLYREANFDNQKYQCLLRNRNSFEG
jgi:hypothetical protein